MVDNVFNNVVKYAQSGTRVYVDLYETMAGDAQKNAGDIQPGKTAGNCGLNVSDCTGSGRTRAGLSQNGRTLSDRRITLSVKNVSREMLGISADELMERFVRGDISRHTEGSGLGLSIAKNLTELQGGTFRIDIDGDLFKVEISFPDKGTASVSG